MRRLRRCQKKTWKSSRISEDSNSRFRKEHVSLPRTKNFTSVGPKKCSLLVRGGLCALMDAQLYIEVGGQLRFHGRGNYGSDWNLLLRRRKRVMGVFNRNLLAAVLLLCVGWFSWTRTCNQTRWLVTTGCACVRACVSVCVHVRASPWPNLFFSVFKNPLKKKWVASETKLKSTMGAFKKK